MKNLFWFVFFVFGVMSCDRSQKLNNFPSLNTLRKIQNGEPLAIAPSHYRIKLSHEKKLDMLIKINNNKGLPFYNPKSNSIVIVPAKIIGKGKEQFFVSQDKAYTTNRKMTFWNFRNNGSMYLIAHHTHSPVSGIVSIWKVNENFSLTPLLQTYGDLVFAQQSCNGILLTIYDMFFYSKSVFNVENDVIKTLFIIGLQMSGTGHVAQKVVLPKDVTNTDVLKKHLGQNLSQVYIQASGKESNNVRLARGDVIYILAHQKDRVFVLYGQNYRDPFLKQYGSKVYNPGWINKHDIGN